MAISRIEFLLFYSVFLIFVIYVGGLAGTTVLNVDNIAELPVSTGDWWLDWSLPFAYFWTFLNVTSEVAILFTLIIMPFIIVMVLVIAEMIRGN